MKFKCTLVLTAIVSLSSFWLPPTISTPVACLPKLRSVDTRLNTISTLLERGLYQESINSLNALIEQHSLDQDSRGYAYCLRGIAKTLLNQYSEGSADIDQGLKENANIEGKGDLYGMRATSLFKLGRYEDAIESINQSLSTDPCSMGFYLRGMIFLRQKKYDLAVRALNEALQYPDCPNDARTMRDLAASKLSAAKLHMVLPKSPHASHASSMATKWR